MVEIRIRDEYAGEFSGKAKKFGVTWVLKADIKIKTHFRKEKVKVKLKGYFTNSFLGKKEIPETILKDFKKFLKKEVKALLEKSNWSIESIEDKVFSFETFLQKRLENYKEIKEYFEGKGESLIEVSPEIFDGAERLGFVWNYRYESYKEIYTFFFLAKDPEKEFGVVCKNDTCYIPASALHNFPCLSIFVKTSHS